MKAGTPIRSLIRPRCRVERRGLGGTVLDPKTDGLTAPTATTSQSRNPGGGRASPGVALHFSRRRAVIGVICVVRIGSGTLCESLAQSGVMADGSLQPR